MNTEVIHIEENSQMKKKKERERLQRHSKFYKVHGQNEVPHYFYVHKALPPTFGTHQLMVHSPLALQHF